MRRAQLGWLLIATSAFVPLVSVPFSEGYRRNAGVIENIQSMCIPMTADKYKPDFQPFLTDTDVGLISKPTHKKDIFDVLAEKQKSPSPTGSSLPSYDELVSEAPPGYEIVKYDAAGKKVFFDKSVSKKEREHALSAGKAEIEQSGSKHLKFEGWILSTRGMRVPFSGIAGGSLGCAFAGVVLLILSSRPVRQTG